jgi:WD40 repeat protein
LTGSFDNTARLWDVKTGQLRTVLQHEGYVQAVAFSRGGQTALTGSYDSTSRLWDVNTGKARGPALKHGAFVLAVAFSHDSQTALTCSADGTARLQDVNTGLSIGPGLKHEEAFSAVAFSPDGQTALKASADTARLWTMDDQGGTRWLKIDEWKRKHEALNTQVGPRKSGFLEKLQGSRRPADESAVPRRSNRTPRS